MSWFPSWKHFLVYSETSGEHEELERGGAAPPLSRGFSADTHRQGLAAIWPDETLQCAQAPLCVHTPLLAVTREDAICRGSPCLRGSQDNCGVRSRGLGLSRRRFVRGRRSESRGKGREVQLRRAAALRVPALMSPLIPPPFNISSTLAAHEHRTPLKATRFRHPAPFLACLGAPLQ